MARTADPAVRTALIEAAAQRLAVGGLDALSLRQVAADAGTSTQAVYTHFGSKDDLVRAVVVEAFARLSAEVRSVPVTDDPLADLAAVSTAYRRNALANAHLYRVMFELNPLALTDPAHHRAADAPPERLEEGLDAFWAMVEHAERCVATGLLHGEPSELGLLMWATAHGVVMLELAGFLGRNAEAVYDAATTATFTGLVHRQGTLPIQHDHMS